MRLSRSGIGLSLLLHALAFYGALRVVWRAPQPPAPSVLQAAIVWIAAPAPPPASPEDRPTATESAVGSEHSSSEKGAAVRSERSPANHAPPPQPPAIAPAATPSPPAQSATAPRNVPAPDLVETRRRAAVEALEDGARADAHRSFAFPGTIAQQRAFDEWGRVRRREQELRPPLTVFDSPAKGRAGLTEEPMGPFGVHWISDDCYVFREPLDRFVLPGLFVEPTTCTRRFARTDLFATAKPHYLMGDEERATVDAETQRRERLRRPTTGAVMPLAKD